MAGTDAFQVEGVVTEAMPNGTYRVELANGHRLLAFVAGRARQQLVRLAAGEKVKLQLTPYDLSQGRILTETKKI
jgi:translation initiation factor IF-1